MAGALAALVLVAAGCAAPGDPPLTSGEHRRIDTAAVDGADLAWWYTCTRRDTAPATCVPDAPAPAGAEVLGADGGDTVLVDRAGTTLVGDPAVPVGEVRVGAADVTLVGVSAEVVTFGPGADGGRLERSRVGSVFVTGADDVVISTNLLRPSRPGPDVIQVKTADGDPVVGLVVVGNVIGPQDDDGVRHTDCVQILGGDELRFERNLVGPCGDKAFQIRSGAGGRVGRVILAWNVVVECRPRRPGCEGHHAVIWAVDAEARLVLVRNTVAGSIAVSTSGSDRPAAGRLVAVGNIADTLPCVADGDGRANLLLDPRSEPCPGEITGPVDWIDPAGGDLHLARVDPVLRADGLTRTGGLGLEELLDGPDIDGEPVCDPPVVGADAPCGGP